ncbi:protein NIM1-INTERACTING 1-like [Actinidia eriantha]|uniref:protein NIM1-INTERACTING 1-like n=1 Tax=Actinidia eriantha TaxID=165200 RepID=UPI00258EF85E|nr:protein NIM1-INTERACTING 1-like [Actinidia eriantha]
MGSEKREKIHGMNCEPEEEEEEEEEEKIEKFFALIRSFRDARDRRRNELKEQSKKQKKRKAEHDHENPQSSWVPKFRLEDFTQEIEFKSLPLKYPKPCNKNHEADKDSVLDLKLKL